MLGAMRGSVGPPSERIVGENLSKSHAALLPTFVPPLAGDRFPQSSLYGVEVSISSSFVLHTLGMPLLSHNQVTVNYVYLFGLGCQTATQLRIGRGVVLGGIMEGWWCN